MLQRWSLSAAAALYQSGAAERGASDSSAEFRFSFRYRVNAADPDRYNDGSGSVSPEATVFFFV